MSSIAIITARGGSKRIPKKNIKEFCGKPIIAYSIEAALKSGVFEEVMVSTDSQEIVDIAKMYGANVPFMRSEKTSDDYATTADVIREVLDMYENQGKVFDYIVCIYPTAPFITDEKLRTAVQILQKENVDSVVPVVKYDFPPQRAFLIQDNQLVYQYPDYAKKRSQDLEPIYHDCGQFYACNVQSFRKYSSVVMPKSMPIIIPDEEVQDIDTFSDWNLAEIKYKTFIEKNEG